MRAASREGTTENRRRGRGRADRAPVAKRERMILHNNKKKKQKQNSFLLYAETNAERANHRYINGQQAVFQPIPTQFRMLKKKKKTVFLAQNKYSIQNDIFFTHHVAHNSIPQRNKQKKHKRKHQI